MLKSVLFSIIFLSFAHSINAKECLNNDLKKEFNALRNDFTKLSKRLETIEEQQKKMESAKNQCTQPSSLLEKVEGQQKRLIDFQEIYHILIKYGNNPDGFSTLHYAIKMGDIYAVNLLLINGADVNAVHVDYRPETAMSALSRAARFNRLEIAQLLLNFGADVNYVAYVESNYSYYPIKYAAEFGSAELVKLLIENGAMLDRVQPINQLPNKSTQTPLHFAAKKGNLEAVIALVNGGAKIDGNLIHGDSVGHPNDGTPLDWAAFNLKYSNDPKCLDLITFLVDKGASRKASQKKVSCPVINGYLESKGK